MAAARAPQPKKRPKLQTRKDELPSAAGGKPDYHDPSQNQPPKPEPAKSDKTYGRNDRVKILNPTTGEEKTVKYKQAQPLIERGQWLLKQ